MKSCVKFLFLALTAVLSTQSHGAKEVKLDSQSQFEREVSAVVRNKIYYKQNHFEAAAMAGIMPYDNIINHYMFGGKFSWHFSDSIGWEVADVQVAMPSVTSYAEGLVQERGLSNLQTSQLKFLVTTNLLISPLYGKIRVFGSSLVFFDVYLALGGGLAKTETVQLSSPRAGTAGTQSTVASNMDPVFDFGLGFKLFLNPSMGLILDLRDYVVMSQVYGSRSAKSNYSVFLGLNFFLPNF